MITKELFVKSIENFQDFQNRIDELEKVLSGSSGYCNIFESELVQCYYTLFEIFIDSNFTTLGADNINYWLFESDKKVIIGDEEYNLETIDELWKFLTAYKEEYFK